MKYIYSLIFFLTLTLYIPVVSSVSPCPQIDSPDEIGKFLTAVQGASHLPKAKRYKFSYQGDIWYMEEGTHAFLTQINYTKTEQYRLNKVYFVRAEKEHKKERCFYTAHCSYVYGEDENEVFTHDFHMTKVVQ